QEAVDFLDVGDAKPFCGGDGSLSVRARHAGQLDAGDLGELLECIESEASAADDADPDFGMVHKTSFLPVARGSIAGIKNLGKGVLSSPRRWRSIRPEEVGSFRSRVLG